MSTYVADVSKPHRKLYKTLAVVVPSFACAFAVFFSNGVCADQGVSYPAYFQESFFGGNLDDLDNDPSVCSATLQGLGAAESNCDSTIDSHVFITCNRWDFRTTGWSQVGNGEWQSPIQTRETRITCGTTGDWGPYATADLLEVCPLSAGGGVTGYSLGDDFGNIYSLWCLIPNNGPAPPPTSCPAGDRQDPATGQCYSFADRNAGKPSNNKAVGEPIDAGSGNLYQEATDFHGGGSFPLVFTRAYNSNLANESSSPANADSTLGKGWSSNIGAHLYPYTPPPIFQPCQDNGSPYNPPTSDPHYGEQYLCPFPPNPTPSSYTVWHADGSQAVFTAQLSSGAYVPQQGTTGQLFPNGTGFKYLRIDGVTEFYDSAGKLTAVQDPHGLQQTYAYSTGQLVITDPNGRTLTINYDSSGRIITVKNNATRTYTYHYDDTYGNLTSVDYPDDSAPGGIATVHYQYNDTTYHNALTGIVDENGALTHSWTYDTGGRAKSSVRAPNAATPIDPVSITYDTDASGNVTAAHVTEATGLLRTLTFTNINGTNKLATANAPCLDCGDHSSSISYSFDGSGNLHETVLDFASPTANETDIVLDTAGREISRTEAANDTSLNSAKRTIETDWNNAVGLPAQIREKDKNGTLLRTTQYCYNTACDGGTPGTTWTKTITDNATSVSRTTTFSYSNSRLQYVDGPRTDVTDRTTFGYAANGDLNSITDALTHQTQITSYDGNGLPLTILDPNSVTTTLVYDARQRLLSKQVSDVNHKTIYNYDLVGNLSKVTPPNGAYLQYTYDDAHIFKSVKNAMGDEMDYTPNAAGDNVIDEQTKDSTSVTKHELQRGYDQYNHLLTITDGMGKITTYGADLNGNITSVADPLGHTYARIPDALNRVKEIDDPANGKAYFTLNALDQLTKVIDPRNLETDYFVDAFGDVTRLVSPDTGTTTYSAVANGCTGYDLAGNMKCKTDAAGNVALYTYDALNRLTKIHYPANSTFDVTYNYDESGHTFGVGRLTTIVDTSGNTSYQYDAWGNVSSKTIVVTGTSVTIAYAYDLSGNLNKVYFPNNSGFLGAQYVRGSTGLINEVDAINTNASSVSTLASNISYRPFGPLTGLTYGNSLVETRDYDLAYRPISIKIPTVQDWTVNYYDDGNVESITDALKINNTDYTETFGYDSRGYLNSDQFLSGSNISYTYDADGNRAQKTIGSTTTTYGYATNSNRLLSSANPSLTYSYDLDGNTRSDGGYTYHYDVDDRLGSVFNSAGVRITKYSYNGLGQLAKQFNLSSGTATLFFYDESGHLLIETNSTGAILRSNVWLEDRPIAFYATSFATPYYVHTDQHDSYRMLTNSTKAVSQMWHPDSFGNTPMSLSSGTPDIRLPGQYQDSITGHYYNYFRDYDPATGRYIESDPSGLLGGVNSYIYVNDNPNTYIDRLGLCWYYSQSTGHMSYVNNNGVYYDIGDGYAGYGAGLNNPAMQNIQAARPSSSGPLPQGRYTIGEEKLHVTQEGSQLPNSMLLTPDQSNDMYGRGVFLIHGSNDYSKQNSSEGCIVLKPEIRNQIGKSDDKCLWVVP